MKKVMSDIYPPELVLVPDDSDGQAASFLDLFIKNKSGNISTSIFDKRVDFDFPIVNFPSLCGNIPKKSSYGVFIGELVRYARACTYYNDFKARTLPLVRKLKKQLFIDRLLKLTWKRFCDSHLFLIQKYGINGSVRLNRGDVSGPRVRVIDVMYAIQLGLSFPH